MRKENVEVSCCSHMEGKRVSRGPYVDEETISFVSGRESRKVTAVLETIQKRLTRGYRSYCQ